MKVYNEFVKGHYESLIVELCTPFEIFSYFDSGHQKFSSTLSRFFGNPLKITKEVQVHTHSVKLTVDFGFDIREDFNQLMTNAKNIFSYWSKAKVVRKFS